ncbi:MAG TPA: hypothetical protein PLL21_04785, partial [Sedimentibacter sp.]|nr:hypothetical protein [Sedimentibacter sp.]
MSVETVKLTGKPVAEHLRANIKTRVAGLNERHIVPAIIIIRVGNKEDDVLRSPTCNDLIAGWSSLVARWAHNPKV